MIKKHFLYILLVVSSVLFSKDYPIMQIQEIEIPLKQRSIIELPFKIEGDLRYGIFKTKEKQKTLSGVELPSAPNISVPNGVKNKRKTPPVNSPLPIITKGVNTIEILPKKVGEFDITAWGFRKYPIILKIKIVNKKDINRYFVFKDYDIVREQALKNLPHEEAISKMIKPLYRSAHTEKDMCLRGHRLDFYSWNIDTPENYNLTIEYECSGKRYAASKWVLTNNNDKFIPLYKQSDFRALHKSLTAYFKRFGRAIYAINVDTTKKYISAHESVDFYIVTNAIDREVYRPELDLSEAEKRNIKRGIVDQDGDKKQNKWTKEPFEIVPSKTETKAEVITYRKNPKVKVKSKPKLEDPYIYSIDKKVGYK